MNLTAKKKVKVQWAPSIFIDGKGESVYHILLGDAIGAPHSKVIGKVWRVGKSWSVRLTDKFDTTNLVAHNLNTIAQAVRLAITYRKERGLRI